MFRRLLFVVFILKSEIEITVVFGCWIFWRRKKIFTEPEAVTHIKYTRRIVLLKTSPKWMAQSYDTHRMLVHSCWLQFLYVLFSLKMLFRFYFAAVSETVVFYIASRIEHVVSLPFVCLLYVYGGISVLEFRRNELVTKLTWKWREKK